MTKTKRIMRADNPISREGRFLLSIIIMLLLVVLAGITFILMAQETQGRMLDQHIQATAIQAEIKEPAEPKETAMLIGTFDTTFYCAGFGPGCPICGTNGITATGTKCSPLGNDWVTIAVDPRVIPYGTKLKIIMGDTVIYGIAEDTGGFASGLFPVRQIDICTANHEEALNLGTKELKVYELKGE
jgi:3D (Asp-Asp-Asp) domain-containing protein